MNAGRTERKDHCSYHIYACRTRHVCSAVAGEIQQQQRESERKQKCPGALTTGRRPRCPKCGDVDCSRVYSRRYARRVGPKNVPMAVNCERAGKLVATPQCVVTQVSEGAHCAGAFQCDDCWGVQFHCCDEQVVDVIDSSHKYRSLVCDSCGAELWRTLRCYLPADFQMEDVECQCPRYIGTQSQGSIMQQWQKGPLAIVATAMKKDQKMMRGSDGAWTHHRTRDVRLFGDGTYHYTGADLVGVPKPAWLLELEVAVHAALEAEGLQLTGRNFEMCLQNRYRIGGSIPWHHDNEVEIDQSQPIISLSLGAKCVFAIRRKNQPKRTFEHFLRGGDICVMKAGMQDVWEHMVKPLRGERLNFTWRAATRSADIFRARGEDDTGPAMGGRGIERSGAEEQESGANSVAEHGYDGSDERRMGGSEGQAGERLGGFSPQPVRNEAAFDESAALESLSNMGFEEEFFWDGSIESLSLSGDEGSWAATAQNTSEGSDQGAGEIPADARQCEELVVDPVQRHKLCDLSWFKSGVARAGSLFKLPFGGSKSEQREQLHGVGRDLHSVQREDDGKNNGRVDDGVPGTRKCDPKRNSKGKRDVQSVAVGCPGEEKTKAGEADRSVLTNISRKKLAILPVGWEKQLQKYLVAQLGGAPRTPSAKRILMNKAGDWLKNWDLQESGLEGTEELEQSVNLAVEEALDVSKEVGFIGRAWGRVDAWNAVNEFYVKGVVRTSFLNPWFAILLIAGLVFSMQWFAFKWYQAWVYKPSGYYPVGYGTAISSGNVWKTLTASSFKPIPDPWISETTYSISYFVASVGYVFYGLAGCLYAQRAGSVVLNWLLGGEAKWSKVLFPGFAAIFSVLLGALALWCSWQVLNLYEFVVDYVRVNVNNPYASLWFVVERRDWAAMFGYEWVAEEVFDAYSHMVWEDYLAALFVLLVKAICIVKTIDCTMERTLRKGN